LGTSGKWNIDYTCVAEIFWSRLCSGKLFSQLHTLV